MGYQWHITYNRRSPIGVLTFVNEDNAMSYSKQWLVRDVERDHTLNEIRRPIRKMTRTKPIGTELISTNHTPNGRNKKSQNQRISEVYRVNTESELGATTYPWYRLYEHCMNFVMKIDSESWGSESTQPTIGHLPGKSYWYDW